MSPEKLTLLTMVLDMFLATFVFFPALVMYWRGVWDLIGFYILPNDTPLNYWVQTAIGACTVFDYFILPLLNKYLDPKKRVTYWIGSRLFFIFHAILFMIYWRGVWMLGDHYITRDWKWSIFALVGVFAAQLVTGTVRNTMWPPFMVVLDTLPGALTAGNRFGTTPKQPVKYVFDSIFTALVAHGLAIFTWRSVWCVWDGAIYPDDLHQSNIFCAAVGLPGCVTLFLLSPLFRRLSIRLQESDRLLLRRLWEGVIYIPIYLLHSMLWRGCWNLNITYLITHPMMGGWVNHIAGVVAFLLLQCYGMVGMCGCAVDGSETGGDAFFPIKWSEPLLAPYIKRMADARDEQYEAKENKDAANGKNGCRVETRA